MNKNIKSSFAILKQEFRLQFITAGLFFAAFAASILLKRYSSGYEDELPKLFIIFYAATFGFALPWQTSTNGHIVPEYCRYNLNLPVHTWQLIVLPLLSRFLLVFLFLSFEFGLFGICYSFINGRHVNIRSMIYYAKISVFVYLLLQAFAWSKDSMKNLFLWGGIPVAALAFLKPKVISRIFDDDLFPVYCLCSAVLLALAAIGVRNLRKGLILGLPGFKSIPALFDKKKLKKEKVFSNPVQAQFHQEWKRAWYIMPLMTLGAIAVYYVIIMKNAISYDFFRYFLTTMLVFFLAALFVPLIGFTFSRKIFSSTYVHNLPISSKNLAAVRLKVFCLSYLLSLGIFLLWILYNLFIDGKLLRGIYSRNQELLYSPGVLVWIFIAFLIWGFSMAFAMISVALQKKSLFTVVMILLMMLYFLFPYGPLTENLRSVFAWYHGLEPNGLESGCSYYAGYISGYGPRYPEFFLFLNILIGGWLCLSWLRTESLVIKFLAFISICALAILYTIVCSQYLFLLLLPLALLFPYPLFVMTQESSIKRHERFDKKIMPSWRLALATSLILACFSSYTIWLNSRQREELNKVVEECAAAEAKNPVFWEKPKIPLEDYLRRNMPFKETLLPGMYKYLEKIRKRDCEKSGVKRDKKLYLNSHYVIAYLLSTISSLRSREQYFQANSLAKFGIEFSLKYGNIYSINNNVCSLARALSKDCRISAEDLNRTKISLREILSNRLSLYKKRLKIAVLNTQVKVPNTFMTFNKGFYHYSTFGNHRDNKYYLDFTQMFFSPLCFCDGINFSKTALTAINAMNYIQKGDKYVNRKINSQLLYFNIYNHFETNQLLESIAAVAMTQYRLKNGKEPANLKQLTPVYLKEGELYLLYSTPHLYREQNYYQPFLKPNSIATVKKYIKQGTSWSY